MDKKEAVEVFKHLDDILKAELCVCPRCFSIDSADAAVFAPGGPHCFNPACQKLHTHVRGPKELLKEACQVFINDTEYKDSFVGLNI
jgi:hypothetical protein